MEAIQCTACCTKVMWTLSIYLEAVAILPQLVLLQRTRNIDNLTGHYVFFLGTYRGFYLLNWVYRYLTEARTYRWLTWISGFVQTALYADFFYYYLKRYGLASPWISYSSPLVYVPLSKCGTLSASVKLQSYVGATTSSLHLSHVFLQLEKQRETTLASVD
ncbi:hypothetical protein L7F22_039678 [Adiantum nelumboides]|nr:hypothetical protein [Adiantum nelumboides]